jgi:hypothetical protein
MNCARCQTAFGFGGRFRLWSCVLCWWPRLLAIALRCLVFACFSTNTSITTTLKQHRKPSSY